MTPIVSIIKTDIKRRKREKIRKLKADRKLNGYIADAVGYHLHQHKDVDKLIPISENEVIRTWLFAELSHEKSQFYRHYQGAIRSFGDPKLDWPETPELIEIRKKIFWEIRGQYALWKPIYLKTKWYYVKKFIGSWNVESIKAPYPPADSFDKTIPLIKPLILWGHNEEYIVLEGNHRWVFHYQNRKLPYYDTFIVGISEDGFCPSHEKLFNCQICLKNRTKDPNR